MEGDQFAPLREASTKLLIGQIPQLPTIEGGCGIYVWVQGTVVDIAKNGNQVTLDDGTGLLVAENVASVIKDPWLQLGKYVMVCGNLVQSPQALGTATVLSSKIADLSHNTSNEMFWWLEVMDIQVRLGAMGDDW